MKIFGDPNGQIKLRAKQKYKVLSATIFVFLEKQIINIFCVFL